MRIDRDCIKLLASCTRSLWKSHSVCCSVSHTWRRRGALRPAERPGRRNSCVLQRDTTDTRRSRWTRLDCQWQLHFFGWGYSSWCTTGTITYCCILCLIGPQGQPFVWAKRMLCPVWSPLLWQDQVCAGHYRYQRAWRDHSWLWLPSWNSWRGSSRVVLES